MAGRQMKEWLATEETPLEIGLAVFGVMLLAGLAVVLFGRTAGGITREQRHAEAPPSPGSIPASRHQNIGAVSAR